MNESALAAVTRGAGEMCSFKKNVAPVGSGEKGCKYFVMVGIFEAFVAQSFLSGLLASVHGRELQDFSLNHHSASGAKRDRTQK